MIRTAVICKAAHPTAWKGKDNSTASLSVVQQEGLDKENRFPGWIPSSFVPEVRKCLASKGLPLKVLLIGQCPSHPEPHEISTKGVRMDYVPSDTRTLAQPSDQASLRLTAHGDIHGKDCMTSQDW